MSVKKLCSSRKLVWESSRRINQTPFYRVEYYDSSTRDKWSQKPGEFIDEEKEKCRGGNYGKERRWTLTNYDAYGKRSSGYLGVVKNKGNNRTEKRYFLKINSNSCTNNDEARKKYCKDLLTSPLHILDYNASKDNPITAPIAGTKCIMFKENSNVFLIIEITRNHQNLPFGSYSPNSGSNIYSSSQHPGLITKLSKSVNEDFRFDDSDWDSNEIYGAPDIFDPHMESAQYKILAFGCIADIEIKPTMKLHMYGYSNYNDDWQQWMYYVTGGVRLGCDRNCTSWFKKYWLMEEGDRIFLSIDGEQSFNAYNRKLNNPTNEKPYNSFISSKYHRDFGNTDADKGEPDTNFVLTWSVDSWSIDDDHIKSALGALEDEFLDMSDIGESFEEIQQLRWFVYHSIDDIMAMTKEEFAENCPNLNLREELLTVGDRGDLVAVVTEQLQNLGFEISNRSVYTANTYQNVIELKKYMKSLDLEFYDFLGIDNPCNEPPDCSCQSTHCSCSTDYPECKSNSGVPCGCITYGTYAFILKYEEQPQPNISMKWKDNANTGTLDSVFSECTPKKYAENCNSSDLILKPNESISLAVKRGWELKLNVRAYGADGSQITDNWGVAEQYFWLKGGDEIVFNKQKAKDKGWPTKRSTGDQFKSPIYHLVYTINDDVETAPNGQNYTTNQNTRIPDGAAPGTDSVNVVTGKPQVIESLNNNITFRIQFIDIRAPFSEWSVYEDSMPPGWGDEYGSSAITKFSRDLAKSFSGELSIEIGVYAGLELSLLAIINLNAGIFMRYKYTTSFSSEGEHIMAYGYSGSASIDAGDVFSTSWKGVQTYPYKLDSNTVGGDICDSLTHIVHRMCKWVDPDSEGLEGLGFDFTRIEKQMLPSTTTNEFQKTLLGKKVTGKWEKQSFPSGDLTTGVEVSFEDDSNNKIVVGVKDLVENGTSKATGTIEVLLGKVTEKCELTELVDGFTSDDVFDFNKLKSFVLFENVGSNDDGFTLNESKLNRRIKMFDRIEKGGIADSINTKKLTPMVSNKSFYKLGLEGGFSLSITNVPLSNIEMMIAALTAIPASTSNPFANKASAMVWVSSFLSANDYEQMDINLGVYIDATAELNRSILLFSLWGIIHFNLILKLDAKLSGKLSMNLSGLIQTTTKYLGKSATQALIAGLTIPSNTFIGSMLLLEVPSCEDIESHTIIGSKLELNFKNSADLNGFNVGNTIEIVGAKNPLYNQHVKIESIVNQTNEKSIMVEPVSGTLNSGPNWSDNPRIIRVG